MKYIGTYSNDADIATKAKVDAKQDKVLVNGILKGDGQGAISAAETQEVELVTLTKADVGLGNVDNVKQYSATNPPPYPVTSVNSKTGAVELTYLDVKAQPFDILVTITNDHYGFKSAPTIKSLAEFYKLLMPNGIQDLVIKAIYESPYTAAKGTMNLEGHLTVGEVNGEDVVNGAAFQGLELKLGDTIDSPMIVKIAAVKCVVNDDGTETWTEVGSDSKTLMNGVDVTAEDNGKFLRVVNGAWAAATVENANGVSF